MIDPLQSSLRIAGSGLEAQSVPLRIISENIANAQSTGAAPGPIPTRARPCRSTASFDRASGASLVRVKIIGLDDSPFKVEHDPGNPAADAAGFVKLPNVDVLTELADMREANRTYEANLQVAKQSAELLGLTVNLLKDA